ncbi:hypothetical protein ACFONN_10205 [Dyella humi]|uniref:Lipoprotein n=1 Tax=Dyella humi TaxID=1770547 RepID=A0ABW8IJI7_9GAMM
MKNVLVTVGLLSLTACSLPFGGGPRDIRVTSVTDVDYKNQNQIDFVERPPHPSKIISRVDFTTSTDLLALAINKDYNVVFALGLCSKDGVIDNVGHHVGQLYWNKLLIEPSSKATPEYAAAITKGPPFTYQVYVDRLVPNQADGSLCFALAGGNMLGFRLRSNVAVVPQAPSN